MAVQEVELLAVIEKSSDPEAQKWLQERSDAVESTQQKFAELTEKFDKVWPRR